jgi:short-subunit dehydrogenase
VSNAHLQSNGPSALITGGGGAIARAIAERLDGLGYRVVLVDRDEARMAAVAARLRRAPRTLRGDLTEVEDIARIVDVVRNDYPALDVLVHNAGYGHPGGVCDLPADEIGRHLDVNLRSVMQLTAGIAPLMRSRGRGRIVAIASMAAVIPLPGSAYYTAAKYGLRGFCLALHHELLPHGIGVSCVCPSAVDTPMLLAEMRAGGSPLNFVGRLLAPDDVARAVVRAIRRPRAEIFVPYSDGVGARLVNLFPWLLRLVLPLLEWVGRRGARRFLERRSTT